MLVYQRVNFMDLSHQKGSLSDENWGEPWHMCIFTSKNIIWLVVWNMTFIFHILWIIIPTDELIFFRGVGRYTTNQLSIKKGAFTIKNWFLNIWILSRSFGLNQQTWVFVHENWGGPQWFLFLTWPAKIGQLSDENWESNKQKKWWQGSNVTREPSVWHMWRWIIWPIRAHWNGCSGALKMWICSNMWYLNIILLIGRITRNRRIRGCLMFRHI